MITMKTLQGKIDRLNTVRKKPLSPWEKTVTGIRSNVGNIYVEHVYGYYNLLLVCNELGGVSHLKSGSKADIATFIDAFISGYLQAKEDNQL